jgi:hypothetical protein
MIEPGQEGVGGSLHLSLPSMNKLNQTDPATFLILLRWAFLRDSYFLYFKLDIPIFFNNSFI